MSEKFATWLTRELEIRDIKPADFARAAGMSTAVVSNLMNDRRHPSVDTCRFVAKGLGVPLEVVFRAADYLPAAEKIDPITETVIHLMKDLSRSEKEDVLEYVRLRHRLFEERANVGADHKRSVKRTAPT